MTVESMSTFSPSSGHASVLAISPGSGQPSVFDILAPKAGEAVLDVTLGLGGHAGTFAEMIGPSGMLIAIDADSQNLADAQEWLKHVKCRTQFHHANFSELPRLSLPKVDILFADLGLSSPHLDDAERGFSFRTNAPLDMRFDRTSGETAADLIEKSSFDSLRKILREWGELKEAGYIARAIADRKQTAPVISTLDLVDCVNAAVGWRAPQLLPRVFQAFRMAVNHELEALETLLSYGPTLLKPGGRMGIISFHSLEDRMVKHVFRVLCSVEKDEVTGQDLSAPTFLLLTKKSLIPSAEEIEANPRARSAKFRAIQKMR